MRNVLLAGALQIYRCRFFVNADADGIFKKSLTDSGKYHDIFFIHFLTEIKYIYCFWQLGLSNLLCSEIWLFVSFEMDVNVNTGSRLVFIEQMTCGGKYWTQEYDGSSEKTSNKQNEKINDKALNF